MLTKLLVASLALLCLSHSVIGGTWHVGPWGDCSAPCGGPLNGIWSRDWTCAGPGNCIGHPWRGGTKSYSPGSSVQQVESCPHVHIPCTGEWSDWGPWGPCSVTCGPKNSGYQIRARVCNPGGTEPCAKGHRGYAAPGSAESESQDCPEDDIPCPEEEDSNPTGIGIN